MWGDVCESYIEDSQGSGSSGTRKQSPHWDRCVVLIGAYSASCPFMETALLASVALDSFLAPTRQSLPYDLQFIILRTCV